MYVLLSLVACSSSEHGGAADATSGDSSNNETAGETFGDTSADGTADASCSLIKPYSSKDAACNACAAERCCAPVNGCLGDPRCDDDYVNCILACALTPDDGGTGDAAIASCLDDCAAMHPAGKAEYDAAIACVDTSCKDVCK